MQNMTKARLSSKYCFTGNDEISQCKNVHIDLKFKNKKQQDSFARLIKNIYGWFIPHNLEKAKAQKLKDTDEKSSESSIHFLKHSDGFSTPGVLFTYDVEEEEIAIVHNNLLMTVKYDTNH